MAKNDHHPLGKLKQSQYDRVMPLCSHDSALVTKAPDTHSDSQNVAGSVCQRARSSEVERSDHTREAVGSIPTAPTIQTAVAVYLVACERFVKIGSTKNAYQRLKVLQTSTPFDMRMVGLIYGGEREERIVQRAFRKLRHRGEWFHMTGDLPDFIMAINGAVTDREAHYHAGQWFMDQRPRLQFYTSAWRKIWLPE